MAEYRVKAGMRFGAQNQYGPGDKVELSVGEAAGFLDKLERVSTPSTSSGSETDDGLSQITPWNGLDAKIVTMLEAAGVTEEMVPTMTDEEILGIDGVGEASLTKIRSALGGDAS